MSRHAEPAHAAAAKPADRVRPAPETGTPVRSPGPAAQLAAVHRTLTGRLPMQLQAAAAKPLGRPANRTGLPDRLRSGVEALSGLAMGDVRVHRDSPEPAKLGALAYAKGSDIHLGPGQEQHLPHEAWHVVQQKQGRVQPTTQMKGVRVNADAGLEAEADRMGTSATMARLTPVALEDRRVAAPAVQAKKAPAKQGLDYNSMVALVAGYNNSGLSDQLIIAQAYKESRFIPAAKNSASSATGLLGITKVAVTEVNRVKKTNYSHASMTDGGTNVQVGTLYLAICLDRKGSAGPALDYYGTGAGYSTNILAAETALKANPSDPMAELIRIIGK